MVGTLAVELRNDLSFSKVALGGLVAIFSGLTAVLAIPAGRLVQRFGYRPGLVVALLLAAVALLGPAVAAGRWWHLAAGQCVAALAASLAISSVPLALATRILPERQGIAFGLNLSSVPASILLAGLAVPLVAETVGWRWALGGTGALALVISFMAAVLLDNEQLDRVGRRRPFIQRRLVFLGSGAMFFGVWGAHSVATFAVEAGVEQGHTAGSIGYALGLASVMSIGVRILAGWIADRIGPVRAFAVITSIIVVGVVGIGLLAVGGSYAVTATGVVLGLGFGWGWNGVLAYGLVRANPRAAALTASIMMTGGFAGSAMGPMVSGALLSGPGFRMAWLVSAIAMAGAGVLATVAGRDPRLAEVD